MAARDEADKSLRAQDRRQLCLTRHGCFAPVAYINYEIYQAQEEPPMVRSAEEG